MRAHMMQASQKKKTAYYKNNVLETLGSIPSDIGSNTAQEVGAIGSDILTALIGGIPKSGQLEPNQVIEFGPQQGEHAPEPIVAPRLEVQPKPNITELEAQTRQQIEVIRQELKELAKSLKGLNQDVQAAVSAEPVDPGVYHMNFYEQLRSFISILRQQIEDSRTWLAAFSARKKKMGYWGLYKKHGTTFGLSNERSLATSAG
jgi:hypothetical protein